MSRNSYSSWKLILILSHSESLICNIYLFLVVSDYSLNFIALCFRSFIIDNNHDKSAFFSKWFHLRLIFDLISQWRNQRRAPGTWSPLFPNSFIFVQCLTKILQNNKLAHWDIGKSWIHHCITWQFEVFGTTLCTKCKEQVKWCVHAGNIFQLSLRDLSIMYIFVYIAYHFQIIRRKEPRSCLRKNM